MSTRPTAGRNPRHTTLLDRFYVVGVTIKGIDGAIELIVGLALLFVPALLHSALEATADRASAGDSALSQFVGSYLENLDNSLTRSGLIIVILFLTIHGAIKLALVYCLLRKLHRAYPVALVVLGLFLVYQVYLFVVTPTVTLGVFAVLDAVIIFLVYREYKELRDEAVAAAAAG
ncbi:MAG TPA: DUF2127 domain-containing protein [Galbitalea sp.]